MSGRAWVQAPLAGPRRLILISLISTFIVTLPVLLFVYHQTDRLIEARITTRVDDRERDLFLGYRSAGILGLARIINNEIDSGIVGNGVILLVDPSGRKLAGNIDNWPQTLKQPTDWTELRLFPEHRTRAELFAVRVFHLPSGQRLLLGTNVEERERMRDSLLEALIGALLLAVPLGAFFGVLIVRMTERHARTIGKVAERIVAGDFTQRLDDEEGSGFDAIARAVNAMLERIEELVEQLRIVTDALAHDLRSPLTRIRANIERAAAQATQPDQGQALEAVSNDIDRMLRLISATLEISRTEAGVGRQHFAEFRLPELLRDICDIYDPVAEERGVALKVETPPHLAYFGNKQLIGQALANLIDNALKYGGPSSEVDIGLNADGSVVRLWVADHGPGIPPELRSDAMSKYGRLEEARTTEGTGLGLAFVRSVARLHGGEIRLEDNRPGLRVVITIARHVASADQSAREPAEAP